MNKWVMNLDLDCSILIEKFNKYMFRFIEPLKISPYRLKSSDILKILEPTFELNAYLKVTTKLSNDIILFYSIVFARYFRLSF